MKQNGRKEVKKGNILLYVLLLMGVVLSMVVLHDCERFQSAENESGKSDMIVAIEYAPLSLYTYNDTLGGFSYDLLRMVAQHAGIKLEYQPMVSLASSLEKLKDGEYRMVCAEFPMTKEHKQEYSFTMPIYLDRQVLVQRKRSDGTVAVASQLDLANDTVWVIDGSSVRSRLLNLSHEIGDTIYVKTEKEYGSEQLFLRVASGEVKYAVMNERVAKCLAEQYPDVDISTGISFSQFYSWMLRHDDSAFCDSVNTWLDEVKKTDAYRELYYRYFPD